MPEKSQKVESQKIVTKSINTSQKMLRAAFLNLLNDAQLPPGVEVVKKSVEKMPGKTVSFYVIFSWLTQHIFKTLSMPEDEKNESEKVESDKKEKIEQGKEEVFFLFTKIVGGFFLPSVIFDDSFLRTIILADAHLHDIPRLAVLYITKWSELKEKLTEQQLSYLRTHKHKKDFLSLLMNMDRIGMLTPDNFNRLHDFLLLPWIDNGASARISSVFASIVKVFVYRYQFDGELIQKKALIALEQLIRCNNKAEYHDFISVLDVFLQQYGILLYSLPPCINKDVIKPINKGVIELLETFMREMKNSKIYLELKDIERFFNVLDVFLTRATELMDQYRFKILSNLFFYDDDRDLCEGVFKAIKSKFPIETLKWILPESGLPHQSIKVFSVPDFDFERLSDVLDILHKEGHLNEGVFNQFLNFFQEDQCSQISSQTGKEEEEFQGQGKYESAINAIFGLETADLLNEGNLAKTMERISTWYFPFDELNAVKMLTQATFDKLFDSKYRWLLTAAARDIVWEVIPPKVLTEEVFNVLLSHASEENPEKQIQEYVDNFPIVLKLKKIVTEKAEHYLSTLASPLTVVNCLKFIRLMERIEGDGKIECIFHHIEDKVSKRIYAVYDRLYPDNEGDDLIFFIRSGRHVQLQLTNLKNLQAEFEHLIDYQRYCGWFLRANHDIWGGRGVKRKRNPEEQSDLDSQSPVKRARYN